MVDLKGLWIGEKVRMTSSGRVGTYEGVSADGRARVKVDGKIILCSAANLELQIESEPFPDIHAYLAEQEKKESGPVKKVAVKFDHTLDLHIDKLAPHLENEIPGRILEYQLQRSREFIRQSIDRGYPHITIIHGKGEGVLREAILHQLKDFHQVRFTFSKNGGGAVEVWL